MKTLSSVNADLQDLTDDALRAEWTACLHWAKQWDMEAILLNDVANMTADYMLENHITLMTTLAANKTVLARRQAERGDEAEQELMKRAREAGVADANRWHTLTEAADILHAEHRKELAERIEAHRDWNDEAAEEEARHLYPDPDEDQIYEAMRGD